jgi:hypothetical protein
MNVVSAVRWFAVASLLWFAGCRKHLEVDSARLTSQLDKRAAAALETPAVEKSLDDLWAAVGADPRVGKSGGAILNALGEDPRLQPGFQRIVADLGQQPVVLQLVRKLMREHPGANPDQIGALVEKRMNGVLDGPTFDRVMNKAMGRFLKRPDISSLLDTFGEKVARNPHISEVFSSTLSGPLIEDKWRDRLVTLNGGSLPDRQRATDLVADEIFSTQRLSKWYVKLYSLPATRREVAAGTARLLDAPAFRRVTADLVASLVADREFQKRAVEAMNVVLADAPTDAMLENAIARLLDVPVVSTALARWTKALMADRELAALGDDVLKAVVAAPEIRATVAELADLK